MSKLIKIPNYQNPCEVIINGVKYQYPAGETCLVPDEVAMVIENVENNAPKYAKEYVSSPDIVETVSGEVITVSDSAEAPLQGLRVFGKTIQNGTPTPEAPVALESVGADGNVTVTVAGRNLFDTSFVADRSKNGIQTKRNADGSIRLSGTPTITLRYLKAEEDEFLRLPAGTYTLHPANSFLESLSGDKHQGTFTLTVETGFKNAALTLNTSLTYDEDVYIQLEAGVTATAYELYKEARSFPIPTHNGLPGIPVASGGNYTDANGQQWICDEVDFEKGVYVQRVRNMTPEDIISSGLTLYGTNDAGIANFLIPLKGTVYEGVSLNLGLCSHMSKQSSMYADATAEGVYFVGGGNIFVRLNSSRASTVKTFKEWVADSNLNIQYILATPIMRNLTEDILAAINTSYPSTTVYNDAGADMEVKYVADTKLYVDNKFNVLAAMINA